LEGDRLLKQESGFGDWGSGVGMAHPLAGKGPFASLAS
jgi:hypothetical protein